MTVVGDVPVLFGIHVPSREGEWSKVGGEFDTRDIDGGLSLSVTTGIIAFQLAPVSGVWKTREIYLVW